MHSRCMCCVPRSGHITVSEMVHNPPPPPPGSAPSFLTTSGAVGLPPSSGGGLHRCSLLHISERTLRKMKTGCVWAARHVRCALTSVHNSVGHKWDLFQFLQKAGCFSCPCICEERVGLMPEDDDALNNLAPVSTRRAEFYLSPSSVATVL